MLINIPSQDVVETQHTLEGEGCYGLFKGYTIFLHMVGNPYKSYDL